MRNITMTAKRVQPSKERAEAWKNSAVHWDITLSNGRREFRTQYSEGMGHFLSLPLGQRHTLDIEAFGVIHTYQKYFTKRLSIKQGRLVVEAPQSADVLHCLAMDATALDVRFEEWAAEYGYDADSRKAYKLWEECCNTARELKALGLTEDDLAALRNEEEC